MRSGRHSTNHGAARWLPLLGSYQSRLNLAPPAQAEHLRRRSVAINSALARLKNILKRHSPQTSTTAPLFKQLGAVSTRRVAVTNEDLAPIDVGAGIRSIRLAANVTRPGNGQQATGDCSASRLFKRLPKIVQTRKKQLPNSIGHKCCAKWATSPDAPNGLSW